VFVIGGKMFATVNLKKIKILTVSENIFFETVSN